LENNYPNPFNSGTVIEYELVNASQVTLKIYDLLGSEIQILIDEPQNPGTKRVFWDGRDKDGNPVSSGVYVYRIEANNYSQAKKMILTR
jgi:flagellar hook assembly protein FlgD